MISSSHKAGPKPNIVAIVQAIDVPKDFRAFKEWLDNAPFEEKREHFESLSPSYIEKHGKGANAIRLCINLD